MTSPVSEDNQAADSCSDQGDIPLFMQIADRIRGGIATGELAVHGAIPSERVIAENHNVSRMTARRALEALEAEGLVYSADRRGRFVSPARITYDVSNMVSFVADAQESGTDLEIEVIEAHETTANTILAGHLAVQVGTPLFEYKRLFRSNGHAIFIETEYLIADRFPRFLDHDLRQSTTVILKAHYHTSARIGDIVIRMRGVSPDEAQLLGLASSHAGIELEQVVRDDTDTPFSFARQLWRGELAEFSARAILKSRDHL